MVKRVVSIVSILLLFFSVLSPAIFNISSLSFWWHFLAPLVFGSAGLLWVLISDGIEQYRLDEWQ